MCLISGLQFSWKVSMNQLLHTIISSSIFFISSSSENHYQLLPALCHHDRCTVVFSNLRCYKQTSLFFNPKLFPFLVPPLPPSVNAQTRNLEVFLDISFTLTHFTQSEVILTNVTFKLYPKYDFSSHPQPPFKFKLPSSPS